MLVISNNRAVQETCDHLLILSDGRISNHGPAEEIRQRMSSGWSRFSALRRLEAEENLEGWIRSSFVRDGDEGNRRNICKVAFELLAFSCLGGQSLGDDMVIFELKLFRGYCLIRMLDSDAPISTGQLARAEAEAAQPVPGKRLSPLAAVIGDSLDLETSSEGEHRVLTAKIAIYDPREGRPPMEAGNVQAAE